MNPFGTAFDADGNLWVSDFTGNQLLLYTEGQIASSSSQAPAATITNDGQGALNGPVGLAFDAAGNLWVGNYVGDSLVQYTAQQLADAAGVGGPSNPTPSVIISSDILNGPYGHAFDTGGDLWVGNNLADNIVKFTAGQLDASGSPIPAAVTSASTSGQLDAVRGPAFDAEGDLWVASRQTHELAQYRIDANGDPVPLTTTIIRRANGGLAAPAGIAFDGVGNLWVTDGVSDELLRYVAGDLADGATTGAARTIKGFGSFGAIGGVLPSFNPPPDNLPLAH
jgi:sugar lactone lactonase YvrE